jgi:hypothetical protein
MIQSTSTYGSSVASVSSSVSVPASNETIKSKEGTLRSGVVSFLNSGPNILKTSDIYQLATKTKIINVVNNATQNVEGVEAMNAIVGIELGKALRSVISSDNQTNDKGLITIATASTCKPSSGDSSVNNISCDNTITIK